MDKSKRTERVNENKKINKFHPTLSTLTIVVKYLNDTLGVDLHYFVILH